MSKIFFTSDTHFGHTNVIKYCSRPFGSAEEMNEKLIENWNSVVGPEDDVFHLGDFSMSATAVQTIVPRLMGRIHLVMGNHDLPHPAHKKGKKPELAAKWSQQYLEWGIKTIHLSHTLYLPGFGQVDLNHVPYRNAYTEVDEEGRQIKVRKWGLDDNGRPLLCGHVHEKWLRRLTPDGTVMVNVGVDAPGAPWGMRPATLEEVVAVLRGV